MSFGHTANVCAGCGHPFTSGCTPKKYCAACRKKFCQHEWSDGALYQFCALCGSSRPGSQVSPPPEEKEIVPMCAKPVGAVARLGEPKPAHPNELLGNYLSLAVAKEVFGCTIAHYPSGISACGCTHGDHNNPDTNIIRPYATSLFYAMDVVEAMGTGFCLNWITGMEGKAVWHASFQAHPSGRGDCPSQAICRGALIRKRGITE